MTAAARFYRRWPNWPWRLFARLTPPAGSGSRPDATPLPATAIPAAVTAGVAFHKPETLHA